MNNKLIIISGAGISAESGISTFRDGNGLWENNKIEEVCNFETWEKNYELVHKFYNQRRKQLNEVEPNIIHKTIAKWQEEYGTDRIINITQNVDDLFEKANTPKTLHLHGYLPHIHCYKCNKTYDIGYTEFDYKNFKCECGSTKAKPSIVFFLEQAPNYHYMKRFINNINNGDIILYIGSSGLVVNIDRDIEFFKNNNYNINTILNNLEYTKYIKEDLYDNVFYENGTKAIKKIDKIVRDKLNKN